MAAERRKPAFKVVADNRRARYDYEIGDRFEAGLMLTGTEVKSLRTGKATIAESYAGVDRAGEMWLYNANIPEYLAGNRFNHEPKRARKLLLKAREIVKLSDGVQREGMTIVPLRLYFNERGRAKLEVALGKGKKLHDKRETERKRDWAREKSRLLRDRGMTMNPTFDHCVIHVSSWERSNDFYAKVLGATVVPRGAGFAYRFGAVQLNCHGPGVEAVPVANVPVAPGNSDLCFEWHGPLDEAIAHLKACRVAIELGPVPRHGVKDRGMSVYFRDPDGSLLEFISYAA